MKMGIIKSVLIKAFIKKIFFSLSALYFKDLFRFHPYSDTSIQAVLINAIIKTGKTLDLTVKGLSPLFRIASFACSCKFSRLLN